MVLPYITPAAYRRQGAADAAPIVTAAVWPRWRGLGSLAPPLPVAQDRFAASEAVSVAAVMDVSRGSRPRSQPSAYLSAARPAPHARHADRESEARFRGGQAVSDPRPNGRRFARDSVGASVQPVMTLQAALQAVVTELVLYSCWDDSVRVGSRQSADQPAEARRQLRGRHARF